MSSKIQYLRNERSLSFDRVSELLAEQGTDDESDKIDKGNRDGFLNGNRCYSVDFFQSNDLGNFGEKNAVRDIGEPLHRRELNDEIINVVKEEDEHKLLLSRKFENESYDSLDPSTESFGGAQDSPAWSSVVNPLKHIPQTSIKASIFSLVASMVGGGTLSIPFAFQGAGLVFLIFEPFLLIYVIELLEDQF
jgi:hypothetical protein